MLKLSRNSLTQFCLFCSVAKNVKEPVVTKTINFKEIKHKTKVPLSPHIPPSPPNPELDTKFKIDSATLELLERLSLVNLSDKEALKTLEESIEFASKILHLDTTNIEPLYNVHEHQYLQVREDDISEGNIAETLLRNSPLVEEEFFVSPPGNIPVKLDEKDF